MEIATRARVPVRNRAVAHNFDHRLYYLLSEISSIEKPRSVTGNEVSPRRNAADGANYTTKPNNFTGHTNTTRVNISVVIISL